ncbi:hypothetical protein CEXT_410831 [Caerostris extrusa]|uniref:Uncharacterized protein n=1 Tax=Caerostris extrusa TaxID=172846 RepID=A0AAV4NB19_CAEEX|nr:hypothetical protein CEXT_410831 [Caerostris extrusa]
MSLVHEFKFYQNWKKMLKMTKNYRYKAEATKFSILANQTPRVATEKLLPLPGAENDPQREKERCCCSCASQLQSLRFSKECVRFGWSKEILQRLRTGTVRYSVQERPD